MNGAIVEVKFAVAMLLVLATATSGCTAPEEFTLVSAEYEFSFTAPRAVNGQVLIPAELVPAVFEATVQRPESGTILIVKDSHQLELKLGQYDALVNGTPNKTPVPPLMWNEKLMLPLEFVADSLGYELSWTATRTATITFRDNRSAKFTKTLTVHFIDVGQGDAILVITPNEKPLLVDGGPCQAGEIVVEYLIKAGISAPDLVLATHPHEDHIGGLISVLRVLGARTHLHSGLVERTKIFNDLTMTLGQRNIGSHTVRVGESIELDDELVIRVLHPDAVTGYSANECSVVLKLTYGEVDFVLASDAGSRAEALILKRGFDVQAEILKVGHHGSHSATTDMFLDAVDPKAAVIPCGARNKYGHPNPRTLERLRGRGIAVYRTDLHSTVIVTTNGKTFDVFTEKQEPCREAA